MRSWKEWAIAAMLLSATGTAVGQLLPSDQLVASALAARAAGDYPKAVVALRQATESFPTRTDYQLLLAETLAWSKDFGSAESLYRRIVERWPESGEARLGLARVLLWQGRYDESAREFEALLGRNRNDPDALEGHATSAYWDGDYRTAAREFRRVLSLDPRRERAAKSLREIDQTARPSQRLDVGAVDDDQPYRTLRSALTASVASDPLTRWSGTIGSYRLDSPIHGDASVPFAAIGNETVFPRVRLTIKSRGELMRYPDGVTRPNGGVALKRQLTKNATISLRAEKNELLATATGMQSHPSLSTYAMAFSRDSNGGWIGAAEIAALRYFDGNRGVTAWTYALAPVASRGTTRVSAGLSATYRDTDDSRFYYSAVSSVRNGASFEYSYRGDYSPYWAPQRLREWRAIAEAQTTLASVTMTLHADGGVGRDRAIGFSPAAGPDPIPSVIYPFTYDRTFHPSRVELTTSVPLPRGFTAEAGFEISRTAYYRAKTFHASLVRRR